MPLLAGFKLRPLHRVTLQEPVELLLLTLDGVYLADLTQPSSDWPLLVQVTGGLSAAAGDLDHDGVQDLAVGHGGGVATFFGKPRLP